MLIREIIRKKRDGAELSETELNFFVAGISDGTTSEGQVAAFAMAVFIRKLSLRERVFLTQAMCYSGVVLDWSHEERPVVDKHSTGGIGDNVSLMLAPALAACGAAVPMISGRGLGHTGGTLDKLEAIPGYVVQPDNEKFRHVVKNVGCAIIGQTSQIAPADKRLYAIRDVTATVSSVDMIIASILSKKMAAGVDALILDVKYGNGAFMKTSEDAKELANSLIEVSHAAGCKTAARITDMNQPLATAAGNAIETQNAIDFLIGKQIDQRLWDVCCTLAGDLLFVSGLAETNEIGRGKIEEAFRSGAAAEKFSNMVVALGGPTDLMEKSQSYLTLAPITVDVIAKQEGQIVGINSRQIGLSVIELGGGRRQSSDKIEHGVGYSNLAIKGQKVGIGDCIGRVHAKTQEEADRAKNRLIDAYRIENSAYFESELYSKFMTAS